MSHFDVFNGDADGLCALHQLRLARPTDGTLVTGVKRDIALLARVPAGCGDTVTVLDVSLNTNRAPLGALLEKGVRIEYFDHHFPGVIPDHPALQAVIDTGPEVCTSLLVDRHLGGEHRAWAVVGAFGDNLHAAAIRAAAPLALDEAQLNLLRELGEYLNYNAYGETVEDLHFPPDRLYRLLHCYADPFAFIAQEPAFRKLRQGYADDMALSEALRPEMESPGCALYILPDAAWSRRASGPLGNRLARQAPRRAHAVLTPRRDGGYTVSVRAPLAAPTGADELCRRFETGGGRKGAAGINHLPEGRLSEFVAQFRLAFGC
jgi:hypothetical protein